VVMRCRFGIRRRERRIVPLPRGEELCRPYESIGARNGGSCSTRNGGFNRLLPRDWLLTPRNRCEQAHEGSHSEKRTHQQIYAADERTA
jgi:hypothetical protein